MQRYQPVSLKKMIKHISKRFHRIEDYYYQNPLDRLDQQESICIYFQLIEQLNPFPQLHFTQLRQIFHLSLKSISE